MTCALVGRPSVLGSEAAQGGPPAFRSTFPAPVVRELHTNQQHNVRPFCVKCSAYVCLI